MDTKIIERKRKEIIIDNVPIGYTVSNEDNQIEHLEIYDNFIHSEYEFKTLLEFIDKIIGYNWVDSE